MLQTESTMIEDASEAGLESAIAYIDGGARGNPGDAGFGVVMCAADGTPVAGFGDYIGETTNNQAEYRGLLAALEWARDQGVRRLLIHSDSQLMVRQMNGEYRVKAAALKPLFHEAKRLAAQLERFRIEHLRRHENEDADRLANLAMDLKGPVTG